MLYLRARTTALAMKLVIQIPCYNEAESLPTTLRELPQALPGISTIETLIVDDGSTDETVSVARALGVSHIKHFPNHRGLARTFSAGLEASLRAGADIIVNTDADNQYCADDISALIAPILEHKADLVIGDRGVRNLASFSPLKRWMQGLGSWVVSQASGLPVPDASSGFRAISRQAALRLLVLSDYSYTLETLIQAGARHMAVAYVVIRTNPPMRPSRLMRSMPHYLTRSAATITRAYTMYRPLKVFTTLGAVITAAGVIIGLRYLLFFFGRESGHLQSVVLSAILVIVGFQVTLFGIIADLIAFNRKILEEALFRLRVLELSRSEIDSQSDEP